MPAMNRADSVGFIPEIWLATALGQLRAYLTIARTVTLDTDLAGDGAFNVGQTLHLPKRGALAVNDKAENVNYTVQNPSSSTINLTLTQHKEVTFGIESRALSIVNQDVIAGYTQDAVVVLAEQVDKDLLNFAGTATTNPIRVGGASLTVQDILSARKTLVDTRTPAAMSKTAIVSTSQANGLLDPTANGAGALVRYDSLGIGSNVANARVGGSSDNVPGAFGRLQGFEFVESQLLSFAGVAPAAPTYKNLFYAEDALLLAFRELELPGDGLGVQASVMTDPESGLSMRMLHFYNGASGAHQITLECLYGYSFMRPEHVQIVTTTS